MDNTTSSISAVNLGQCIPKTASRCITESVTATHDFEVINYSLLDGMGVGKFVSSSTFSVGGFEWILHFYPDGGRDDCKDYASAYLRCLKPVKQVMTSLTLSMLDKEGKVEVKCISSGKNTFSPITPCLGYNKIIAKSKLKSLSDLHQGSLIIRCVLTVIKESCTEAKTNYITIPDSNLQKHLQLMCKDGEGADVTFSVSGQVFNAHRCVLAARSPVFKAELFGPMKEKTTRRIKIDDMEPQIFQALLHFIYTDSLLDRMEGETEAELQHLLVAADRYGLDRLKVICESKLSESIGVENAATTLVLAEQHHCNQLREACIEFIAARKMLSAVMATDGFNHLEESCPHMLREILAKVSQGD